MWATTLKPLIVNVGSDVRNLSGYKPLVIPQGSRIWTEECSSLSSNVWVSYGYERGKIECGHVQRLVDRGDIELEKGGR